MQSSVKNGPDMHECLQAHKQEFAIAMGAAFLAGCLITAISMGCGFTYYISSSRSAQVYDPYEVEMADETQVLDEDFETQSSERKPKKQVSWLQKNFD